MAKGLYTDQSSPLNVNKGSSLNDVLMQTVEKAPEMDAQYQQDNQALRAKNDELYEDMKSVPTLKAPELTPMPDQQEFDTDPAKKWGSAAMWIATFGSMLTRQPLVNSLNSMAAVNTAFNEGDAARYKNAYEKWKVENENAGKLFDFQKDVINSERDKYKDRQDNLKTADDLLAAQFNFPSLKVLNQAGQTQNLLAQLEENKLKADKAAAEIDMIYGLTVQELERQGVTPETATPQQMRLAQFEANKKFKEAMTPNRAAGTGSRADRVDARIAELQGMTDRSPEEESELQSKLNERAKIERGGMDPTARGFGSEVGKAQGKTFAELQNKSAEAQNAYAQLDLALQASRGLGWLEQGKLMGKGPAMTTDAQTVDSQRTEDALNYIQKTKGSISEREMQQFNQASAGRDSTPQFRENKYLAAQAVLVRDMQRAAFQEEWQKENTTTLGADQAFKRFAEENPIFEVKNGEFHFLKSLDEVKADTSYLNYLSRDAGKPASKSTSLVKPAWLSDEDWNAATDEEKAQLQ